MSTKPGAGHRIAIASAVVIALWRAFTWKFQITTDNPAKYFGRTDIEADSIMWGAALALAAREPRLSRILSYAAKPAIWIVLAALSISAGLYDAPNWKSIYTIFAMPDDCSAHNLRCGDQS